MALEKFLFNDEEERRRAAFGEWARRQQGFYESYKGLLKCVRSGDVELLDEVYGKHPDLIEFLNVADEKNKATVLHYAAGSRCRDVILWLCRRPEIDHLVLDKFNRLPSALAFEFAHDFVVGRYLARKECDQANREGIDLRDLLIAR